MSTPWIQRLAAAPLSERGAMLEALVTAEFRSWLLMGEADLVPLDESYFALGLTSIGAVELQQRLEEVFGRRIDSSSLFNNPTIGHLLAHIMAEVLDDLFVSAPASKEASAEAPSASKALWNDLLDQLYES